MSDTDDPKEPKNETAESNPAEAAEVNSNAAAAAAGAGASNNPPSPPPPPVKTNGHQGP
jgi:hypothetical protein